MGDKKDNFHYILLVILLVFGTYKTYISYHKDYFYPYHHDEWQHIGISTYINEQNYNKQHNPYLDEAREHKDLESGFHLFLASISEFYGFDLILIYKFFPALWFLISGLILYFAISKITGNKITGIVSLIIFIFLKSNINVLGKDFFVPLTMTLPFIFTYILYFSKFLKKNKKSYLYFLVALLLFLFFVYPPSFIMMLIPSIFISIFNFKVFKNKKIFYLFVPIFISLLYFFWRNNILSTINYIFEILYFEPGWGKLEIKYSIPLFFGIINTLLALYGFYISYKKKNLKFFVVFSFLSLLLTAVFNLFYFSVLIPYNRALHYTVISLMPLSAIGFVNLSERYLKKKTLIYLFISIFFVFMMFSKYPLDEKYKQYHDPVITKEAYSALLWFRENYGENRVLVSPYFMTSAIYPISKNRVISLIPSQLEGGLIQDNLNFFSYDCEKKLEIIKQSNAEFVLSYNPLDCDFLHEIYSNNFYIYSLQ